MTSFSEYIAARKRDAFGGDGPSRYAYAADVAMLRSFSRIRPIEMAAKSVVRMFKDVQRNQLLGTTIRVGPEQFPSIYAIAKHCAERLDVPVPTVYVTNDPRINAFTFGTDEESYIVVHSALIDHFDEEELKFVIGHETGHIQNKHVVYGTVLILLERSVASIVKWILPPAEIALQAWYRRAEITCDRAGLLCVDDEQAPARSFLKMACGSKKLYGELNVDAYLEQLDDGREGVGRFVELFASHPYLPKRIQALRVFAESELYRSARNEHSTTTTTGLSMEEVDRRTSEIIQVVKGAARG